MMPAAIIAAVLHGKRVGRGWVACCPAHDDHDPSLSIDSGDDGRPLVFCHGGCSQAAVVAALKDRGLWGGANDRRRSVRMPRSIRPQPDKAHLTAIALHFWERGTPIAGSCAETYLAARGLRLPATGSLRFHNGLRHQSGLVFPALMALVQRRGDGQPMAIHRTYLDEKGRDKAPVTPERMMLGPCRGGAVQLASVSHSDILLVGEGIETTLAAMQASDHPGWAALSTSGLRSLDLPPRVRNVIVLGDGDDPGEAAALAAAKRWAGEGRSVRIARAPRGQDFNDVLVAKADMQTEERP
jgi:putative DNA primase/helicase